MNAFAGLRKFIHGAYRRPPLAEASKGVPEPAFGKPRPMTGFLATLTEEQKEAVLSFKGPDLLGDPKKIR